MVLTTDHAFSVILYDGSQVLVFDHVIVLVQTYVQGISKLLFDMHCNHNVHL